MFNAIMHKDYYGGPVFVWVYDDRLVFFNQGLLTDGLTPEGLLKPHPSVRRNPTLAQAMYRGGLVETWGRGTTKIIDQCREWGIPAPLFDEDQGGIWVTLFADRYQEDLMRRGGLSQRQIAGVLFAKQHGQVTNADYQKINQCSRRTATRDLGELVEQKWLVQEGTKGSSALYFIKNGNSGTVAPVAP
jgi:ATP-dependent DNA helicase RecG